MDIDSMNSNGHRNSLRGMLRGSLSELLRGFLSGSAAVAAVIGYYIVTSPRRLRRRAYRECKFSLIGCGSLLVTIAVGLLALHAVNDN